MTLEYATGLEFCNATNAIGVFVLNTGDLAATTRIIVNQETGGTSVVFFDSGVVSVNPKASFGFSVSVTNPGFFWLQIFVSSNEMVPNARFVAIQGTSAVTFMPYPPNSFAVFDQRKL
jgi:hypothetical protein